MRFRGSPAIEFRDEPDRDDRYAAWLELLPEPERAQKGDEGIMSYCELIIFKDGKPSGSIEYRNAWGGAARIWDALFERYLKDPAIPYHTWLCRDQKPLWALAKRESLPMFERAVHASTLDHFYVRRENFPRFCADLRAFDAKYPSTGGRVNHLGDWADAIEKLDADVVAIGFHGTSVAENPWHQYDEEKDETIDVPLSEGWEVYDWLESGAKTAETT